MPPYQGLAYYNDKMLTMAEHWDSFILDRASKQPNVWHDRVPRGSFPLYQGLSQKSNIYRGGLGVQSGLSTWTQIGLSRKPSQGDEGFDNCGPRTPQRYTYAWETIQFNGFEDSWQSDPVCLKDLRFVDYAREQLAMVVRSGVDYGVSMLENWNREMYVNQAVQSGHTVVLCEGAIDYWDDTTYRFTYDPFTVDANGKVYVTFSSSLELSTLNWSVLDFLRTSLSERAAEAALGKDSNMPIFGLMIDLMDFERFVLSDDKLREDFRYAKPQDLIQGYNMGFKNYRGFALMHDPRQMRFKVEKVSATTVTAVRVDPMRAGRAVTIGNVPEPNPEYYQAELAIGVIFMNDVFTNLFPPNLNNLGSGMTFGPAPGLTGDWQWVNIKDNVSNQLGETGYFLGRFEIFPKPLMYSSECTVFLYRRCPQSWKSTCEVQERDDVGTGAIAVAVNAASGDVDATNYTVTLTLASKLEAGIGDAVSMVDADGGAAVTAIIAEDALAPTYKFAKATAFTTYDKWTTSATVTVA